MVTITLQIQDEHKDLVLAAMLDKYPKPPNFTNLDWIKEIFRRQIKMVVIDYSTRLAIENVKPQVDILQQNAIDSVVVPDDITG